MNKNIVDMNKYALEFRIVNIAMKNMLDVMVEHSENTAKLEAEVAERDIVISNLKNDIEQLHGDVEKAKAALKAELEKVPHYIVNNYGVKIAGDSSGSGGLAYDPHTVRDPGMSHNFGPPHDVHGIVHGQPEDIVHDHVAHVAGRKVPNFPPRDTSKTAEQQGLFDKYRVSRTDGKDYRGSKHHGCDYFVIDMDHDPAAGPALITYAAAVVKTHPVLASELIKRFADVKPTTSADGALFQLFVAIADSTWADHPEVSSKELQRWFRAFFELLSAYNKYHYDALSTNDKPQKKESAEQLIDRLLRTIGGRQASPSSELNSFANYLGAIINAWKRSS